MTAHAMQRSSLAIDAYHEVRRAILDGRLDHDRRLGEVEVATMLGVSRTPVRQALRQLELEGYVRRDEGGRLSVQRLTAKELREVFFVRELLEGYGARVAALRISEEELGRLGQLLAADREADRRGRIDALATLNDQIHGVILVASRNRVLVDLTRYLRERVPSLKAFAVGSDSDRRRFVEEHAALVELLQAGEANEAEALVRRHLRSACDLLVADLEAAEGFGPDRSEGERDLKEKES